MRLRLASTHDELVELVENQNASAEALMKEIAQIVIYSESISYSEVWNMTFIERKIISEVMQEYAAAKAGKDATEML
tara:strand:+ start:82 stop:312 length:231 start_codon:yes stop_codon:yes gene_type:complete